MKIRRENIWECLTIHKYSCLHKEEMDLFLLWLIFSLKSPIFHFHQTIHNIILQNIQKEQLTQKLSGWLDLVCFCKFRQREWSFQSNGLGNARSAEQGRINSNNKHTRNHKNLSHKCTHNKSTFRAGISSSANLAQCTGIGQGNTEKHGYTWINMEREDTTDRFALPWAVTTTCQGHGLPLQHQQQAWKETSSFWLGIWKGCSMQRFSHQKQNNPQTFLCNVFFSVLN